VSHRSNYLSESLLSFDSSLKRRALLGQVSFSQYAEQSAEDLTNNASESHTLNHPLLAIANFFNTVLRHYVQTWAAGFPRKPVRRTNVFDGPDSRGQSGLQNFEAGTEFEGPGINRLNACDRRRPLVPVIYVGEHSPDAFS